MPTCPVFAGPVTNDLLLVSDAFKWNDGNALNTSGITFSWVMINHRYENIYLAKPYVH